MGLALDEPKDSDGTYDNSDLKFVVDNDLMTKCGDIKIEYHEQGYKSGFAISSTIPVSDGGSCGSSCSSGSCS